MKKTNFFLLIALTGLLIMQSGCSSMFAHLFGNDYIKDNRYKFLMFDDFNSKILYGGYIDIKTLGELKFTGEFKIIDVFAENIPVGSGIIEGIQNEEKDKAEMFFKSKLSEEKITVKLDRTWNLLEGSWKYKTIGGKFIAFENN